MATEALHKLEEQLTCSICLEQFTNPKILPCFHSFCVECLKCVVPDLTSSGNYSLPCPTCRSPCETKIDELPPSFTINNLLEVYDSMTSTTVQGHTSCDGCENDEVVQYCKKCAKFLCQQCLQQHNKWTNHQTLDLNQVSMATFRLPQAKSNTMITCQMHSDEQAKLFCETCDELICHLCTYTKRHKDHDLEVVNDDYSKHKLANIQQSSLRPLSHQIDELDEALATLTERRNEIAKQGEKTKQATHEAIYQIKELLDEEERKINQKVDQAMNYKLTAIDHQIEECESLIGQLTEWRDQMQRSLSIDTLYQVLSFKAQMVSRTKQLLDNVKNEAFIPTEQANLKLVKNKQIEDINWSSYIGTLEYSFAKPSATVTYDHTPVVGQKSTFEMTLCLRDMSPSGSPASLRRLAIVGSRFTPPNSPKKTRAQSIECAVESELTDSGHFNFAFTPHTRGSHQLNIKLQDRTAPDSPIFEIPLNVPVSVPVTQRGNVVRSVTGLKGPRGVAVSDDGQRVFVTEYDRNRITRILTAGGKSRSFGSQGNGKGKGELVYPCGIAITPVGTLLVVDCGNCRIQEFSMDGECLSCVGSKGNGPLQFHDPRGIAINKTTRQVYVADTYNHRVQVLNADLSFTLMIGSRGSAFGQLTSPKGIAIDDEGSAVYVADSGNHRIQKFTPEGTFVSSFGSKGSNEGQLTHPLQMHVDKGLLYVTEGSPNHRISVFDTTTGECVHCFGHGLLENPYGIAMDTNAGYLYVCHSNGVSVF